jgi:hypothetical protein
MLGEMRIQNTRSPFGGGGGVSDGHIRAMWRSMTMAFVGSKQKKAIGVHGAKSEQQHTALQQQPAPCC